MFLERGVIAGFSGSWMSGLGLLVFEGGSMVHCENAPTVRALEACFGDVIGEAHCVDADGGHVGQEIVYSTDFVGVLEWFVPIGHWPGPEIGPEGLEWEDGDDLAEG